MKIPQGGKWKGGGWEILRYHKLLHPKCHGDPDSLISVGMYSPQTNPSQDTYESARDMCHFIIGKYCNFHTVIITHLLLAEEIIAPFLHKN